jgi:hypothetical protein
VEGALQAAPLNRAVDFTGVRRLQFAGASQGTLTAGTFNPDANADQHTDRHADRDPDGDGDGGAGLLRGGDQRRL